MIAAKETTLKQVGEMLTHVVEHMATKADVRAIVRKELEPLKARLTSIESERRQYGGTSTRCGRGVEEAEYGPG